MRVVTAAGADPGEIARDVAAIVRAGGIVVLPTDTVYGIFCDAGNEAAIAAIYERKERDRTKALAIYVADVDAFEELAAENAAALALGRAFLPGPLTLVIDRPRAVSPHVAPGKTTVAVRLPDHDLLRAILRAAPVLAGTSANRSGSPAYGGGALPADFPSADLVVDDGATRFETESTIVDVSRERSHLLRAGAIPTHEIEKVLGSRLR